MRYLLIIFITTLLIACGKDDNISYPKSYTYSRTDHTDEGLFVVNANGTASAIPVTSGSYGTYREELKSDVASFIIEIFNIHLIELLSENEVYLLMTIDEEEFDTTVSYTVEEGEIIIEALQGSNLFSYNKDDDQFELCSKTQIAIPGPEVINPGQEYYIYHISECKVDHDLADYLQEMLDEYTYKPQDTLGILITKLIYK